MNEQLKRIEQKLSQAKAIDKGLEVFGADDHEYHLITLLSPYRGNSREF